MADPMYDTIRHTLDELPSINRLKFHLGDHDQQFVMMEPDALAAALCEKLRPLAAAEIARVDIDRERLRAEAGKFRGHSVIANQAAWKLGRALGYIPDGVDSFEGPGLIEYVDEVIRRGLPEKDHGTFAGIDDDAPPASTGGVPSSDTPAAGSDETRGQSEDSERGDRTAFYNFDFVKGEVERLQSESIDVFAELYHDEMLANAGLRAEVVALKAQLRWSLEICDEGTTAVEEYRDATAALLGGQQ